MCEEIIITQHRVVMAKGPPGHSIDYGRLGIQYKIPVYPRRQPVTSTHIRNVGENTMWLGNTDTSKTHSNLAEQP